MNLNEDAITEFLTMQYVLGDHTFRKGEKAKRPVDVPKYKLHDDAKTSDVEDALKESIKKATKGKEKIGFLLSGGKDSRLLLALTKSLGLETTALSITDRPDRAELAVAGMVANSLDVPHKILELPDSFSPDVITEIIKLTDGLVSFLGYMPYCLLRDELSENFDVILTGDLVTEIMDLCEYRWYESKDPISVIRHKHFVAGRTLLKEEYVQMVDEKFVSMYKDKSLDEIILDTEIRNRRIRGLETIKAMGISIAAPVLDGNVIGATFSLPFEKRTHGRLATAMLKESFPKLANIRTSQSVFPLYFPWWVHFGIQRLKDDMDFIKKGKKLWDGEPRSTKLGMFDAGYQLKYTLGDYVREEFEKFDFIKDMIKPGITEELIRSHFSEEKNYDAFIAALLNVKIWMQLNTA
jgi:hypothetical protein